MHPITSAIQIRWAKWITPMAMRLYHSESHTHTSASVYSGININDGSKTPAVHRGALLWLWCHNSGESPSWSHGLFFVAKKQDRGKPEAMDEKTHRRVCAFCDKTGVCRHQFLLSQFWDCLSAVTTRTNMQTSNPYRFAHTHIADISHWITITFQKRLQMQAPFLPTRLC